MVRQIRIARIFQLKQRLRISWILKAQVTLTA